MGMDARCDLSFGVYVKDANGWSVGNPFYWSKQQNEEELVKAEEDLDLGEYLALRSGLVNPYEDAEANPNYDTYAGWAEGTMPADFEERTSHWYAEQRRLADEAPIVIVRNGSTEAGSAIVIALKKFHHSGDWEKPTDLGRDIISPDAIQIEAAIEFCGENDIFPFDNPSWLLSASYE